jgi:hypothetical protein
MRTTIVAAAVSFFIVLLTGNAADAQNGAVGWYGYHRPYTVQHHASTVEEGVLRGAADLQRSAGWYNYLSSLAAINWERARAAQFDNRVKGIQTYFQVREINREARARERGPRPTQQQLFQFARDRAPKRFSAEQFEATTGELHWPAVFFDAEYATEREAIDQFMALRTFDSSGAAGEYARDALAAVQQMQQTLKSHIHDMRPSDYVAAKSFLKSLAYEARLVPGI